MLEQRFAAFGHIGIYRADNLFEITALFLSVPQNWAPFFLTIGLLA